MKVAGIDSCGVETTLVLADCDSAGATVVRALTLAPRMAAAGIVDALDQLLAGQPAASLHAMVVVRGPGSFTGMRIGLSCAKGFAAATGVPLAGVSRLGVLASSNRSPWAALDAGRGRVYLRETATGAEQMCTAAEARTFVPQELWSEVAVCDAKAAGIFSPQDSLQDGGAPPPSLLPAPDAAAAVRYALPRLLAGEWDDAERLDALYLWREEQMFGQPAKQP